MNYAGAQQARTSTPMSVDEIGQPGGAPTKQTLAGILAEKRMRMLAELRDIEQALEALERTPEIETTLQHVMRFLQRSY